ncbi:MAG: hypothetical protein JWO76_2662 [Nocardioides sp.]|nr:hypothetical protein [Nocardioides sp.]
MSDHDERLAALLADAVSDVEPTDALEAIRDRTRVAAHPRRPWFLAAGGAVVATAAVITAIALATGDPSRPSTTPGPATHAPSVTVDSPTPPGTSPTATLDTVATGIYYVSDTPKGPRLYREFARVPSNTRLLSALELLTRAPQDPDYRTPWPAGSFTRAGFDGIGVDGQYSITLADASLHDRPAGMTEEEARMAVQAAIFTVQAAGQGRGPVQFYLGNNPVDQVFGLPTSEAVTNDPVLETLALVSLTTPTEGDTVSGSLEVEGVANSYEGNVHWQLLDGEKVVEENAFTAEGYGPDKLYRFTGTVDLTGVPPGSYTFLVETDDPSGGAEGNGPDVDTRTVVVR